MNAENANSKALEEQIEQINENIKELQYNQMEELITIQKNHATNMKKLNKLQEYNKIADMTNQIFEKRLLVIEEAIKQINKSISA